MSKADWIALLLVVAMSAVLVEGLHLIVEPRGALHATIGHAAEPLP